jgi:hypothetical protein
MTYDEGTGTDEDELGADPPEDTTSDRGGCTVTEITFAITTSAASDVSDAVSDSDMSTGA